MAPGIGLLVASQPNYLRVGESHCHHNQFGPIGDSLGKRCLLATHCVKLSNATAQVAFFTRRHCICQTTTVLPTGNTRCVENGSLAHERSRLCRAFRPCCMAQWLADRTTPASALRDAVAIRHPQLRHSVHDRTRKCRFDLLRRHGATPHRAADSRFVSRHRGLDQSAS